MELSNFHNAKVGDKVWSILRGYGEITKIQPTYAYPLIVEFINSANGAVEQPPGVYTLEGKSYAYALYSELYHREISFEVPLPPRPPQFIKVTKYVVVYPQQTTDRFNVVSATFESAQEAQATADHLKSSYSNRYSVIPIEVEVEIGARRLL